MFDNLTDKISSVLSGFAGKKTIEEGDLNLAIEKIREALIDADVALPAIEKITKRVKEEMLGAKVIKKVAPFDMIVKACHDVFVELLSDENEKNDDQKPAETVVKSGFWMVLGLQGSGKTTTCAKMAHKLKNEGKKVLLASLDIYRFAAQEQLRILAEENDIDSLEIKENENQLQIVKRAKQEVKNYDVVLLDTAGRLQIDEKMMIELIEIKAAINPSETILVLDAMMGQSALQVARTFHEKTHVTGLIFTRIDSDVRGGAIISVKSDINRPVKYLGVGEKVDDLEGFHAERIAGRILGMGDVVTMVEKAQENIRQEEIESMMKRLQDGSFDLHDFYKQMKMVGKMGGMAKILGFMPGMGQFKQAMQNNQVDDGMIKKNIYIMDSMTKKEKSFPNLLNQPSRQKRVARGAGVTINDLQKLMHQFEKLQKAISKMKKMSQQFSGMPNLSDLANMDLGELQKKFAGMDMNKIKKLLGQ